VVIDMATFFIDNTKQRLFGATLRPWQVIRTTPGILVYNIWQTWACDGPLLYLFDMLVKNRELSFTWHVLTWI
jgi:hypothetical protein